MFGALDGLPPGLIYALVAAVILVESMGVPLPGEITLVSAALLAATGVTNVWGVAIAAAAGAIVGDSIGYLIGRRGGEPLLRWLGQRFPSHFGPAQLDRAQRLFHRWGAWAVFVGRFIALLRILAGPLAGALRMRYPRFLLANAGGGIAWSFATTWGVYALGHAAADYLKDFSWVALALAVVIGGVTTLVLRRRAAAHSPASAEVAPADDDDVTLAPAVTITPAATLIPAVTLTPAATLIPAVTLALATDAGTIAAPSGVPRVRAKASNRRPRRVRRRR